MLLTKNATTVDFNFQKGTLTSVSYKGVEITAKESAIFAVRLLDKEGNITDYTACEAGTVCENGTTVVYSNFPEDFEVRVVVAECEDGFTLRFAVKNNTDKIIEHIETLPLVLKPFVKNGGIGKMLFPYNEGLVADDDDLRAPCHLHHLEPAYPIITSSALFPNMLCSQFLAYLFEGKGLYIGTHDEKRGPK